MKTSIILAAIAFLFAAPAMADISQGDGAKLPLSESPTNIYAADSYAHLRAAAHDDLRKCRSGAGGWETPRPYECLVGTGSNGSEGGSDANGE